MVLCSNQAGHGPGLWADLHEPFGQAELPDLTQQRGVLASQLPSPFISLLHHHSSSHRNFLVVCLLCPRDFALRLLHQGTFNGFALCHIPNYVRDELGSQVLALQRQLQVLIITMFKLNTRVK